MLTKLKLGNFKSWRDLEIDLAPITLLFGTNSSGKTSILQSILLIVQTIRHPSTWDMQSINFGGNPNDYVDFGGFGEVVYRHDLSNEILVNFQWVSPMGHGISIKYIDDELVVEREEALFATLFDLVLNDNGVAYLGPLRRPPQRALIWTGVSPDVIEPDGSNTLGVLISSERQGNDLLRQVSVWLSQMGLTTTFAVKPLDKDKRFYEHRAKVTNVESSLLDVGFGVSQVLPLITMLYFVPEGSIVLIEQPELHLHPSAQAELADLFLEVAEKRKLQLIVESHSEHLLRRIQRRIAEPEQPFATNENIRAYFCEPGEDGSKIRPVEINAYGQINNWPANFFGDITGDLDAMLDAGTQRRLEELSSSE
jgi:ABC-type cobalamin/Fe3+-siderophores transport system ATPase subunit